MTDLVARLSDEAGNAIAASRPKSFDAALRQFTATLRAVPDYPAAGVSDEGFARMNAVAEQVISEIERRLEGHIGDDERREWLTGQVYAIREALEEAFRWRRHFLTK